VQVSTTAVPPIVQKPFLFFAEKKIILRAELPAGGMGVVLLVGAGARPPSAQMDGDVSARLRATATKARLACALASDAC
jgi:hypothetical protein